ncbi:MAG: DUF1730 domain-containing protein [Planctomycetaceae bacterium]|nr:DUF1730 domain-containing protein [Planctomycetaceae bacterium]
MTFDRQTEQLVSHAREIGFKPVGICPATEAVTFSSFERWLEQKTRWNGNDGSDDGSNDGGYDYGMDYLERHREARRHPLSVLRNVKSLLVVGLAYDSVNPPPDDSMPSTTNIETNVELLRSGNQTGPGDGETGYGAIAEYARGFDYHDAVRSKLTQLAEMHRELFPDASTRIAVDTAPILEREYAFLAGLGWPGKNTMLINEQFGSRFFLGILLSTAGLTSHENNETRVLDALCVGNMQTRSHCGNCRKCIDACPTGALDTPYQLDARKCLNYWTIEHRLDDIPLEIRKKTGNRLYGCDTCQTVCPYNRHCMRNALKNRKRTDCQTCQPYEKFRPAPIETESQTGENRREDFASLSLREQLIRGRMSLAAVEALDETTFQKQFAGTPILRLGLSRLKRNALTVRNQ